jgi:DNA topoisomerase-1
MGDATETNGHVEPGISNRFGPVQKDGDIQMTDAGPQTNGSISKRKSRASVDKKMSYAEPESSEEDQPLVRRNQPAPAPSLNPLLCGAVSVCFSS